jgi:glycosyltransferase involved in cell wall biosynthesis
MMHIAQVAPLFEPVPPRRYGGTERIVSYLTEELVRLGHNVTLFASGDSRTSAKLVPLCRAALWHDPGVADPVRRHQQLAADIPGRVGAFDVVHYHIDPDLLPLRARLRRPNLTTLHGRLDLPGLVQAFRACPETPVVSISNAQRAPVPWLNWQGTVHHGLPPGLYRHNPNPGNYFAFLGRMSPEKGVDRAIRVAVSLGVPLRIAARVADHEQPYFERCIRPWLANPLIEFVGEIGDADKQEFLGNALALLFLIDWPEPFGVVVIEALACGTPVIAFNHGSVPELIDDGVTGFVVSSTREAIQRAGQIESIQRSNCRAAFEARFTARVMAERYLSVYQRQVRSGRPLAPAEATYGGEVLIG